MPRHVSLNCNTGVATTSICLAAARKVMAARRDGPVGRPESRRFIICGTAISARTGDRVYKTCTYNQKKLEWDGVATSARNTSPTAQSPRTASLEVMEETMSRARGS